MFSLIGDPSKQDTIQVMLKFFYQWIKTTSGMEIQLKSSDIKRCGDNEHNGEY
jgi:hypothetical protein